MTTNRSNRSPALDIGPAAHDRNGQCAAAGGQWTGDRRHAATNTLPLVSGRLHLAFFTSMRTETVTQIRSWSGAAGITGTPTICRKGLWDVDDSTGNLSNGKLTTNDVAMWTGTNGVFTKTLSASHTLIAGKRYAAGALIVSAGGMPQLMARYPLWFAAFAAEYLEKPVVTACVTGLTDLATSYTYASLTGASGGNSTPIFRLLP